MIQQVRREQAEELRRRAEERLASRRGDVLAAPEEVRRLIHELEVHQIELEMQSEELLQAQLALEEARDRYVGLYDLAPVGYLTLDSKGAITDINHAAAALLGLERGRARGRTLASFLGQEDADLLHRHLLALREAEEGRAAIEISLRREGGPERRVILDSLAAWENGKVVCRSALIDCTAQRAAEQMLREREARLGAILDAVVDGVITLDEAGVIESANLAAERLFGYPRGALLGRDIGALLPAARARDPDRQRDALARALRGASPMGKNMELLGRRQDGTTFPLELGVSEVRVGAARLLVLVLCDVSARQQQEQELRHAHRMEAIGTLASGIAHDFNNLLMAIGGNASLALRKLAAGEPPQAQIGRVVAAVDRGAALTRQILGFAGTRSTRPEPIEIDPTVSEVGEMLRRLLGEQVRLTLRPLAPRAFVLMERGEIEQILLNLAANARDAMPGGGELIIETRREVLERPGVTLLVRDTGCGMDEATCARVFTPFFTTKEVGRGSGLGLAMVYQIMKRLDGSIQVTSEVGRGSEFALWFPETAQRPQAPDTEAPRAPHGETVLVVDDDALVRASVGHYLEVLGYQPILAEDAEDALRRCQAQPEIALMLTDVMMPGRLGGALAADVRAARPGLPVLFMSAQPGGELVRTGKLAPGDPLIAKPFDEGTLGRALAALLSGARA